LHWPPRERELLMHTQSTQRRSLPKPPLVAGQILLLAACVAACASTPGDDDPASLGAAAASAESLKDNVAEQAPAARLDGDDGAAPGSGYFSCATDSSCVAVRLISEACCYNGWKIAVASDEVEAYLAATACDPLRGRLCPQYVVLDRRVPTCDQTSHQCTMVEPAAPDASAPPTL
jgi:hypothetical protein